MLGRENRLKRQKRRRKGWQRVKLGDPGCDCSTKVEQPYNELVHHTAEFISVAIGRSFGYVGLVDRLKRQHAASEEMRF